MYYVTTMTTEQFDRFMSGQWTGKSNGVSRGDSIDLIGVDRTYKGAISALTEEQGYDVAVILSVGESLEDYAPSMAHEWASDRITCPYGLHSGMFTLVSWGYIDIHCDYPNYWDWVVRVRRWLTR